jgi:hypothetical protein
MVLAGYLASAGSLDGADAADGHPARRVGPDLVLEDPRANSGSTNPDSKPWDTLVPEKRILFAGGQL